MVMMWIKYTNKINSCAAFLILFSASTEEITVELLYLAAVALAHQALAKKNRLKDVFPNPPPRKLSTWRSRPVKKTAASVLIWQFHLW